MGNCIRQGLAVHWADDDWDEDQASETRSSDDTSPANVNNDDKTVKVERERVAEKEKVGLRSGAKEVKLKVSKMELDKLLGRAEVGLPVEELLVQLVKASEGNEMNQRPWTPVLDSIPEAI